MNNKYFHLFFFFIIILINPKHVYAVDLSSTTPADNATQIAVNTGIVLAWPAAGSVSSNNGNVILKKTSHAKLTLGIGAALEDGLNISFMVDHYRNDNEAFNTSLTANIRKEF